MASTASAANLSPIQEIVELGGEVIVKGLSKQQFYKLSEHYPELLMEREKNGNICIMTPVKDGSREVVTGFDHQLSGEEVLPGFVLDLSKFRLLG